MTEDQKSNLIQEARETANRLNKLNAFMATDEFPKLERIDKDLLYSQSRTMNRYLQILGKRIERMGGQFTHEDNAETDCEHKWEFKIIHSLMSEFPTGTRFCKVCGLKQSAVLSHTGLPKTDWKTLPNP